MDQQTGDVARLFELISGVQIRARRIIEGGLRVRGLTYAQFSALVALNARNGMSQAELAQALDTDSTTAMVLRTSLEKKGLVARVDDPEDGRVKRIEITDAGKSALQSALPEARNLYAKAGAQLSETELRKILPAFERLNQFLGESSSPHRETVAEAGRKGRPRKEALAAAAKAGKRGRAVVKTAGKAPAKRGTAKAKAIPAKAKAARTGAGARPKAASRTTRKAATKAKTPAKRGR
jgi:MarR family transcriptional regulator for hemolysin